MTPAGGAPVVGSRARDRSAIDDPHYRAIQARLLHTLTTRAGETA